MHNVQVGDVDNGVSDRYARSSVRFRPQRDSPGTLRLLTRYLGDRYFKFWSFHFHPTQNFDRINSTLEKCWRLNSGSWIVDHLFKLTVDRNVFSSFFLNDHSFCVPTKRVKRKRFVSFTSHQSTAEDKEASTCGWWALLKRIFCCWFLLGKVPSAIVRRSCDWFFTLIFSAVPDLDKPLTQMGDGIC